VNTSAGHAERYRHYYAQIRCQQALLKRLFSAMKDAGVWDGAIVVIQGDHGSRIVRELPIAPNAARLGRQDFNDCFSTLFAVRNPGLEAGIAPGPRPLQELLAEALDVPMQRLSPQVYLRTEDGKPFSSRKLDNFR
jgi:arylsulfatase A-like enzyme